MEPDKQLATLVSVLAVIGGAIVLWLLLERSAGRARRHFETALARPQTGNATPQEAEREHATTQRRLTALRLVVNAAKYALAVFALLTVLSQINGHQESLLLPAGFLGAALGFGSQSLVRDIVSGFFIVFEGQFAVGDFVTINTVSGRVEEVGLRVTSLRAENGQIHFFPNGAITAVARYPAHEVSVLLLCSLLPDAQVDQARTAALSAVARFDQQLDVLHGPPTEVPQASPGSLAFRLGVQPSRLALVLERLPARVKAGLQEAQIPLEPGAEVELVSAVGK